jgi:bifunctional oligoribonuclease and PAP phosphatase NrnA
MTMNDIVDVIHKSNKVGITCHISPDGDSIGSVIGLTIALRRLNKDAYIISKEQLPGIYSFLPYSDEINGECYKPTESTDCVIVLDCGNMERINFLLDSNKRNYVLVNIDHHLTNGLYGEINYIDTKASAVGEIVYTLLKTLDIEIDKDIAQCLYTAVMTDCGSFRYSNTTPNTHYIAADLISTGIDFNDIFQRVYENKKFKNIKLLGKIIENMELALNEKVCVMQLTKSMCEDLNVDSKNVDEVINIGMQVEGVEVTVLFKELEEGTKVSLRSRFQFDVRRLAEAFGGGGHTKASGFMSSRNISECKKDVLKLIEKEMI